MNDLKNVLIGQRYRLESVLGSGSMGIVYRVYDPLTDGHYALKQIRHGIAPVDFEAQPKLEHSALSLGREFRMMATLHHANIMPVLDFGFDNERRPYYTMPLLQRPRTIAEAARGCDLAVKVTLLVNILQALAYLHRRGILHRDLKPSNVLVDENDNVYLADFGLSVELRRAQGVVGTLLYMAPELLQEQRATEASDLYSFGALAFEILAGQALFDTRFFGRLMYAITHEAPAVERIAAPVALQQVIARLLIKDPQQRYKSAQEVIQALYNALDRTPPQETTATRDSFLQAASFVGREREMQQLSTALEAAQRSCGSAWLIAGEAGVGKTRLVEEMRTQALVRGFQVAHVKFDEVTDDFVASLCLGLEQVLLTTPPTKLEASILKAALPHINRLVGYPVASLPELETTAQQRRLLQTLQVIIKRHPHSLLIILEDLHKATPMIELLRPLFKLTQDKPLFVIGTYRNDEYRYLYGKFPVGTELITLPRLTFAEVKALAVSMLGDAGRRSTVVKFIMKQSEGNVFFIIDALKTLMQKADRLEDIGLVTLPENMLSQGLVDSAMRRLERLHIDYHPLLRFAAVIGRRIDFSLLEAVDDEMDYDDWLAACADAALLDMDSGEWRFSHDKIRDGILQNIEARRLPELHRLAAEAIEAVYPNRPDYAADLARHWRNVSEDERERKAAHAAAAFARRHGRFAQAEALLRRANDLYGGQNPDVLDELASVVGQLGKFDEEAQIVQALMDLVGADPAWELRAIVRYMKSNLRKGTVDEDAATLVQNGIALAEAGAASSSEQWASAMYRVAAQWHLLAQRVDEAHQLFERALHHAAQPGEITDVKSDLAFLALQSADWQGAERYLREGVAYARQVGDVVRESACLGNLCLVLLRRKAYSDLYKVATVARQLSEQMDAATEIADNVILVGIAALYLDKVEEARVQFRYGVELLLNLEAQLHQIGNIGCFAHWYAHHGQIERAAELIFGVKNHPAVAPFIYHILLSELENDVLARCDEAMKQRYAQAHIDDIEATLKAILHDLE